MFPCIYPCFRNELQLKVSGTTMPKSEENQNDRYNSPAKKLHRACLFVRPLPGTMRIMPNKKQALHKYDTSGCGISNSLFWNKIISTIAGVTRKKKEI